MRAVWSYWPLPGVVRPNGGWPSARAHLLSWVLSVGEASKHYDDTMLITDQRGKALLVDDLGLRFATVSESLESLRGHDPSWWALGKIAAYREQREPFLHLDSDVILWQRLPPMLESAAVLAQNPEHFTIGDSSSWYVPDRFEALLLGEDGWLPREWRWYRATFGRELGAICCGVYGGQRVEFLRYCADLAFEILDHPRNASLLKRVDDGERQRFVMLLEQFLPMACLEYHSDNRFSSHYGAMVRYYFHSIQDARFRAVRCGFTHLMGASKADPKLVARLESRVKSGYPDLYLRCAQIADRSERPVVA